MATRETWTRSLSRVVAVLLLAVLAGACQPWTMFGFDATHSGDNSSESAITATNVASLVTAGVTAGVVGPISSAPVAAGGMLYVTADGGPKNPHGNGTLFAYAGEGSHSCIRHLHRLRQPCKPAWHVTPAGDHGLNGSPAVDLTENIVYVGAADGILYAYNTNGVLQWKSPPLGGSIESSPTIADGSIYVSQNYGWTFVFPLSNGSDGNNTSCATNQAGRICYPEWAVKSPGDVESSPAVAEINGEWYLYTTSGLPFDWVWAFEGTYSASCSGTPYGYNNGHYHVGYVAQCPIEWYAEWGPVRGTSPVVNIAKDLVYVGTLTDGLQAFSADGTKGCSQVVQPTGEEIYGGQPLLQCNDLWTAPGAGSTDRQIGSSPALDVSAGPHGIVYIGDRNGNFYAFDAVSGSELWTVATEGTIDSQPAIAGGVVYVGCSNRLAPPTSDNQACGASLYAFSDSTTGGRLWTTNINGSNGTVDNNPLVVDENPNKDIGAVLVASSSGSPVATDCFSLNYHPDCTGQVYLYTPSP